MFMASTTKIYKYSYYIIYITRIILMIHMVYKMYTNYCSLMMIKKEQVNYNILS